LIVRGPGLASKQVIDTPMVNLDWLPTLLELAGAPAAADVDGISQAVLLRTAKASARSRTFYWHLPHYTNQGSRPAGAVREGAWKLVAHYDSDTVSLFNLENDVVEANDLAKREPSRAAALGRKLADWRRSVGAQENTPNPAVNMSLYDALYVTFDPTRFDPLHADEAVWKTVGEWRKRMDAAIQPPSK
jgi:arylsulfatase A-like enzyme